jgi:hypothetical protein
MGVLHFWLQRAQEAVTLPQLQRGQRRLVGFCLVHTQTSLWRPTNLAGESYSANPKASSTISTFSDLLRTTSYAVSPSLSTQNNVHQGEKNLL